MNAATFAGRVGRDAETRYTQAGKPVTGFSLAVDKREGKEKGTLWIDCTLWAERGEKLAPYLTKGTAIAVTGEVDVRTYESKGETRAALTLNVREVTLLGGGERSEKPAPKRQESKAAPTLDDDEIPFAPMGRREYW